MKSRFTNCFDMTEKAVEAINKNIAYGKENFFDVEKVKSLNLGSIVQILTSISYSLAIIADKLTETQEGKE